MSNRHTVLGEWNALLKNVETKGKSVPIKITFEEFKILAAQPCAFCGERTPGYECNALSYRNWRIGYTLKDSIVICWPCKRVLGTGFSLPEKLAQVEKICTYLQNNQVEGI